MIVRANISTNIVDVSLDGANKTADFALSIRPSGNNQTSLSLNNSSQLSTGIRTYSLRRLDLSPGEYGLVQAQWGDVSLNVPVAFNAIGPTRYSTYNTPDSNHPTCSGPTQPAVLVDFVTTRQACHYGAITFFSPAIRTAGIVAWANAKGYFGSLLTAGVGYRALGAKNNASFRGARH